jgi:uncharacterized membrane protein
MTGKDRDLSDPYVKWFYAREARKEKLRKVVLVAVGIMLSGSCIYCFATEHEMIAAIIGAFLLAGLGVMFFVRECRDDGMAWKTIIGFIAVVVLFFVIVFAVL